MRKAILFLSLFILSFPAVAKEDNKTQRPRGQQSRPIQNKKDDQRPQPPAPAANPEPGVKDYVRGTWKVPFDDSLIKLDRCNADRLCGHPIQKAQKNCGPNQRAVDNKDHILYPPDDEVEGKGAVFRDDRPNGLRWEGKIVVYCTLQGGTWRRAAAPRRWKFVMTKVDGGLQFCVDTVCQTWTRAIDR